MGIEKLLRPDKDTFNSIRRAVAQFVDQKYAIGLKQLKRPDKIRPFKGPTRFSLITVNYSTTHYLKLMLLTLCEQEFLSALTRIVIVDNHSKDGGVNFLGQLAAENKHVHLIKNRINCNHANGLRKGIKYVNKLEQNPVSQTDSNALLICDPDIVFRNPRTLNDIATVLAEGDTVFAGELRHGLYPYPEAQASFLAIRRDCYFRSDIDPIVYHGAPAYFMQRSMWKAGLKLVDFPSNHGGYILHRGRSGVSAAHRYHRYGAYSTARNRAPHFMGVKGGDGIWADIEDRYRELLKSQNEQALLLKFNRRFEGWQP